MNPLAFLEAGVCAHFYDECTGVRVGEARGYGDRRGGSVRTVGREGVERTCDPREVRISCPGGEVWSQTGMVS